MSRSSRIIVHMIGNAHLDPVWLWPWQDGVDEALATFRSACDRCDEYPDFIYTRGEAWLYQQVERLDPALFTRVRGCIERGQWHISGGQYLQPDANLPTLAGWNRQIEHGQRYFQEKFGITPRVGYNVDTFGHPATLPDILAGHGYLGYVFHRPAPHQVELPAQTFRWRGTGGGEVIGYRIIPVYTTRSDDLYGQISLALEGADASLGHTMCFYGVGNHGGGPTKGNIEYILENRDAFPNAELRFSTPLAFFDAACEQRENLPVVTHELQHTFPGCYVVMHDIKAAQVRGEHALDGCARAIESFSLSENEKSERHARLDAAWNDLLFTQFHDILAGTSVPSSWASVRAMQGRARIVGEELVLETTRRWAKAHFPPVNQLQLALFNLDSQPLSGWVEAEPFLDFDPWGERWLSDTDGEAIPFQRVQPEAPGALSNRVLFHAEVPAQSSALVLVRDDATSASPVESDLDVSTGHLSNSRLRVELRSGGVGNISLDGQPLLGECGISLQLRRDEADTWGFHIDRFAGAIEETLTGKWVVEESGPLRARVRMESHLGHSSLRWTLSLYTGEPRLDVMLEANWNEKFRLLQMPIQLTGEVAAWTDGLAGGEVERRPNPIEYPVGGWSRVRLENGPTVALVTPDAYSLSLHDNLWTWSLLRSPRMAWGGADWGVYSGRNWHTDEGPHRFEWTLLAGDPLDAAALHTKARQMAQPPVVWSRYEGLDRPPWKNDPPSLLWTGAEQRARLDGRMMHLLEGGASNLEQRPETAELHTDVQADEALSAAPRSDENAGKDTSAAPRSDGAARGNSS